MNESKTGKSSIAGKRVRLRPVPAVKRCIDILFRLAAHDEPRGVSRIAREVGILPSSCLHILRELVAGGLARFDDRRKTYSLGPGILTLAQRLDGKDSFVDLAQPRIDGIAREFRVKATASVYDGQGHIVVVATTPDNEDVHIHIPVGMRVPMLASATGRVLGAFGNWPEDQLKNEFAKLSWQRPMPFRRWQSELQAVRESGIAADKGQYRKGITVLAAPVPGKGRMVEKFIGASTLSEQLSSKSMRELARALKRAAKEISETVI